MAEMKDIVYSHSALKHVSGVYRDSLMYYVEFGLKMPEAQ